MLFVRMKSQNLTCLMTFYPMNYAEIDGVEKVHLQGFTV